MEKPIRAFYKARVTYKNPEWIDGLSSLKDMEYFFIKDIVLMPPPDSDLDVVAQHMMAQGSLAHFWSGNVPLAIENDIFVHPNRIIKIEIVNNIEVATVQEKAVKQAVVG